MSPLTDRRRASRYLKIALALMFVFMVLLPVALGALDTGDLRCVRDGTRVDCEYVESLFGVERDRRRIEHVTGARLDHSSGKARTYRTVLQTRAGEVPLSRSFTDNRERNAALVERVAQFAVGAEPFMELSQPGWGWPMVAGMTCFWLALAWLLPRLVIRPA